MSRLFFHFVLPMPDSWNNRVILTANFVMILKPIFLQVSPTDIGDWNQVTSNIELTSYGILIKKCSRIVHCTVGERGVAGEAVCSFLALKWNKTKKRKNTKARTTRLPKCFFSHYGELPRFEDVFESKDIPQGKKFSPHALIEEQRQWDWGVFTLLYFLCFQQSLSDFGLIRLKDKILHRLTV